MQRHLIGFIFAALMFVAGCLATGLYRKHYDPYRWVSFPRAEHYGAFHSRTYQAWDGQLLDLYCHTLNSEQEAQGWFSERLSDAAEILERTAFLDDNGNQVGDRAVVVYPPTHYRGRISAVVLLKGINVYVNLRRIAAPSLGTGEAP
jgi:hypothetical protein